MAGGTRRPDIVVVVGSAVGQGEAVVDLDVMGRVPSGAEAADSTPLPVDLSAEPLGSTTPAAHSALTVADRPGVPSLADLAVTEGAPGASWLGDAAAVETRSWEEHGDLVRSEGRRRASVRSAMPRGPRLRDGFVSMEMSMAASFFGEKLPRSGQAPGGLVGRPDRGL